MKCYIFLRGEVKGPLSLDILREMLAAEAIHDLTLVAPEGGNKWRPAGIFLNEPMLDSSIMSETAMPSDVGLPIQGKKWHANRQTRIAVVLVIGIGVFLLQGRGEKTKPKQVVTLDEIHPQESQFELQYVSRSIHELYMQGYRNPAAAELSREMLSQYPDRVNTEGGMKDRLIVLGADDRLQGNPVRLISK